MVWCYEDDDVITVRSVVWVVVVVVVVVVDGGGGGGDDELLRYLCRCRFCRCWFPWSCFRRDWWSSWAGLGWARRWGGQTMSGFSKQPGCLCEKFGVWFESCK